jgi:hypothetical protein
VRDLPGEIGPWRRTEEVDFEGHVLEILQCTSHLNRTYVNDLTGEVIHLALLAGPPGPMSVHTPEICYSSREFVVDQEPARAQLGDEAAGDNFWQMRFKSRDLTGDVLEVWYAWTSDGTWEAPSYPRFKYGAAPLLYKIQVASYVPPTQREGEPQACEEFLRLALPALKQTLSFN